MNETLHLALLLSLKDAASNGIDRFNSKLREMGTQGREAARGADRTAMGLRQVDKEARTAVKSLSDLKQAAGRDLAGGVAGIALLMAIKKGTDAAGQFEASLTDLKLAFSEVGQQETVFAGKLNQLESLSVRLGNKLPGNTEMFVNMLAQLKQGGIDADTVITGAGEAVANLAVVTNQLPKDLAKDYAAFGKQFNLTGQEYIKAADLFARVSKSRDLTSGQLIEASKYFQLRAGSALGFKGFEGAETAIRLMAALKSFGMEGGVAGTGSSAFFREIADAKKLTELNKTLKTDLQFFDKSGKFLGLDNAFSQMAKLQKLSEQQRMQSLNKLLGDEGAAVGNVMVNMGLEGWRESNAALEKTLGLTEMIDAKTKDYNSKVEALSGTLENLKVTAFTPLLDTLKPVVDYTNELVGSLQQWSKDHQGITAIAVNLIGVGSATLIVTSGINAMRTAWTLWKAISAIGSSETGLLGYLRNTQVQAAATTTAIEAVSRVGTPYDMFGKFEKPVETKLEQSGRSWKTTARSIGAGVGGMLVQGFAVGLPLYALTKIIEGRIDTQAAQQRAYEAGDRLGQMIREGMRQQIEGKLSGDALNELRKQRAPGEAIERVKKLGVGQTASATGAKDFLNLGGYLGGQASEFTTMLALASKSGYFGKFGYSRQVWRDFDLPSMGRRDAPEIASQRVKGMLTSEFLYYPEQLKAFLDESKKALQAAGEPELYPTLKRLAGETYPELMRQVEANEGSMKGMDKATQSATHALSIFELKLQGFQPMPGFNNGLPIFPERRGSFNFGGFNKLVTGVPSRAIGGVVERDGMAMLHAGNVIHPAKVTKGLSGRDRAKSSQRGGDKFIINIPPGSRAANDPRVLAEMVAVEVRRQRERS